MSGPAPVLVVHRINDAASGSAISRASLAEAEPLRPHGNRWTDFVKVGIRHSGRFSREPWEGVDDPSRRDA